MQGELPRDIESVRRLLFGDHERLDALFVQLMDTFGEGVWDDVRAMWTRLDSGLTAHLDAEERHLLPLFARVEPVEAAGLLAEHARLRAMLAELGVGVDLHSVSLEVARRFVEALRAHARREDKLFYRWAERIDASAREATVRELTDSRRSRVAARARTRL
jgi:Hemerythrin HHE cation binding domain